MPVILAAGVKNSSTFISLWRTWSPVLSLAIAAIAVGFSISQNRIARKALRISLRQEARYGAQLSLNLKEAVQWRPDGMPYRYIAVRVLVVNPTDALTSLVNAELRLSYSIPSGRIIVVKVPTQEGKVEAPRDFSILKLPEALSSNGAIEGFLLFRVDDTLIGDGKIEGYEIAISDSRGISRSVYPWIMKEEVNGDD